MVLAGGFFETHAISEAEKKLHPSLPAKQIVLKVAAPARVVPSAEQGVTQIGIRPGQLTALRPIHVHCTTQPPRRRQLETNDLRRATTQCVNLQSATTGRQH